MRRFGRGRRRRFGFRKRRSFGRRRGGRVRIGYRM